MNLLSLIEDCEERTGWNPSDYRTTWRKFLNGGVREWSRRYPWPGLEDLMTMQASGSHFLIFPHFVDTVVSILNKSQHGSVERDGNWDRSAPQLLSQRTTGRVEFYDHLGTVASLADPVGYLYLKSEGAGDVVAATIKGYVNMSGASGTAMERVIRTATINGNGINAVTFPELFTSILSVSKYTETAGDYVFYDAGNSNRHISFISRYDDEAGFKRVQLMYSPAEQTLLEVRFRHKIPPMRNDQDAPHASVDPDYLIQYAVEKFWKGQHQFSKAQVEGAEKTIILQDRSNKDRNFDEAHSQMFPWREAPDPDL